MDTTAKTLERMLVHLLRKIPLVYLTVEDVKILSEYGYTDYNYELCVWVKS
jgi:hypothetical protein